MIEVRHVRPEDWESLKVIRLEALTDSPDAFCATYEEAVADEDSVWIERSSAVAAEDATVSVLAFDDDETVGMAVGTLCTDGGMNVLSLFVTPGQRGTDTASQLMTMIETWGLERGANRVTLEVLAGSDRAATFYARLGYQPTGRRETYPGRVWLHRIELTKPLS